MNESLISSIRHHWRLNKIQSLFICHWPIWIDLNNPKTFSTREFMRISVDNLICGILVWIIEWLKLLCVTLRGACVRCTEKNPTTLYDEWDFFYRVRDPCQKKKWITARVIFILIWKSRIESMGQFIWKQSLFVWKIKILIFVINNHYNWYCLRWLIQSNDPTLANILPNCLCTFEIRWKETKCK